MANCPYPLPKLGEVWALRRPGASASRAFRQTNIMLAISTPTGTLICWRLILCQLADRIFAYGWRTTPEMDLRSRRGRNGNGTAQSVLIGIAWEISMAMT